jgi:hypothetical protein
VAALGVGYILGCAEPTQPGPAALVFTDLGADGNRTCGVTPNGSYCWGANAVNALGTLSTEGCGVLSEVFIYCTLPLPIAGSIQFQHVDPGGLQSSTCGLATDSRAYCWGSGFWGQLGTGAFSDSPTPVLVSGALRFTDLSAGDDFTCGVIEGGDGYCWGSGAFGRTGHGSVEPVNVPTLVSGGLQFRSIRNGSTHACGLTTSGAAYCWGANYYAQLGSGTVNDSSSVPIPVGGGLTFAELSAGDDFTCGLRFDGTAYCWGVNWGIFNIPYGPCAQPCDLLPVQVPSAPTFSHLSAGGTHACGLTSEGRIYCWGANVKGELGQATPAQTITPVQVAGDQLFVLVSAGWQHTCALTQEGAAYCWGDNQNGQLGNGTVSHGESSPTPTAVLPPP